MKHLLTILLILCSTAFSQCLGDVNEDGQLDILDVVVGINIILDIDDPTEAQLWA